MLKKMILSLSLCLMVFSLGTSLSLAQTSQQKMLLTKIQKYQSVMGMIRSSVYKSKRIGKPEFKEAGDLICTYDEGMTKVYFESSKEKPSMEGSSKDKTIYIKAMIPKTLQLTLAEIKEILGKDGASIDEQQMVYDNHKYHLLITFENGKCTNIQFFPLS